MAVKGEPRHNGPRTEPSRNIDVYLPERLIEWLAKRAKDCGVTRTVVIRRLIEDEIERL